ncbi:MAG TPA: thiamine pyrophosphate-dependent enzyme, partial [Patescibacteria group bacterium]|nr:thiamine pyrophosphate-dependent enzyme [Patescibacteria group bacterium]
LPGIETSSGPLGSGLSQGIGMALAAKMDKKHHRIIVLGSDGEHQEGNVWEAVMCAAKYTLDNLVYIIDRNYIQIEGNTEEVMPLDSLAKKYKAFNWHVLEINGHRYEEIINAIAAAQRIQGKPVVIIARTIPGKGVKYMENDYQWHGKAPNNTETEQALQELQQVRHQIEENAYEY